MKNENAMLYGIIGLLLGVVLTLLLSVNAVNTNNSGMMQMMGMRPERMMKEMAEEHDGNSMSMSGMVDTLKGKRNDKFDEAFIELMIDHHQGAIDMAKLAQQYAGHDEIKNLANDIITAQTSEIGQMRQWFKDWGY